MNDDPLTVFGIKRRAWGRVLCAGAGGYWPVGVVLACYLMDDRRLIEAIY